MHPYTITNSIEDFNVDVIKVKSHKAHTGD